MHAGAQAASGDLLIFLHADTRLPDDWYEQLEGAWSSPRKPAATAFRLGFDDNRPFYRFLARAANARTRLTGVPQGDQAIAIERKVYFHAGGFPDVPLMEEYLLIDRLARLGRVELLAGAVATSVRRYEKTGPFFNALRNGAIVSLFYLGVPPRTLARLYR